MNNINEKDQHGGWVCSCECVCVNFLNSLYFYKYNNAVKYGSTFFSMHQNGTPQNSISNCEQIFDIRIIHFLQDFVDDAGDCWPRGFLYTLSAL